MATPMLSGNREHRFGDLSETCDPNSSYAQVVHKLTFSCDSDLDFLIFFLKK